LSYVGEGFHSFGQIPGGWIAGSCSVMVHSDFSLPAAVGKHPIVF
jgi:hypothetical protein